jgi:Tfp pilus assembly protein PilX
MTALFVFLVFVVIFALVTVGMWRSLQNRGRTSKANMISKAYGYQIRNWHETSYKGGK